MSVYASVDLPEPFGPMIACTSFVSSARSTPFTISVPSSRATCRFFSSSSAMILFPSVPGPRAAPQIVQPEAAQRAGFWPALVTRILAGPDREADGVRPPLRATRERGDGGRSGHAQQSQRCRPRTEREARCRPRRRRTRLSVEAAVRARVARERLEQVVRRIDRFRLAGVLAFPAHAEEHLVAQARRELLAPEELLGAPAYGQLADRVLRAVQDCVRERLGLVDRRHRLRLVADLLAAAVELRRVDRARQDAADVDARPVLLELGARRLQERPQRRLRRAVRRLERDPAIRERRVHVDERPARLLQVRQRRLEEAHPPEEVHVEDAAQLVLLQLLDLAVDGHHVRADHGVDPPEGEDRALDEDRDVVRVRDVPGHGERLAAGCADLLDGHVERGPVARRDDDAGPARARLARDCAAEAARRAGHDDHLIGQRLLGHGAGVPFLSHGETGYPRHMGSIGAPEIIGLLLVALLLFGAKRLPEIGRSLGSGMREFKDSVTGKGDDEPPAQLPPPAVTMTPPTPPEAYVAPPSQQPPPPAEQ